MRKHVTQFSKKELQYVTNRFKSVKPSEWKFTPYSKKRLIRREVDSQVMNTIWSEGFDIVEYHFSENRLEHRVLIRSVCTDKNDNQVCVVFNFTTMTIQTVYLNERNNKHQDQFHSEYSKDLDVISMMKTKYSRSLV